MSFENAVLISKFENSKFSQNIAAGDRKRAKKCPGVLAGANFNALRRVGVLSFSFLSFHGAKHSSSGRRLGNPGGVRQKYALGCFNWIFLMSNVHEMRKGEGC